MNPEIDIVGNKFWYNENKLLHREDGPAVEFVNGEKEWFINGERHREGGPAREFPNGDQLWSVNGKLHRLDGPAIIHCKIFKHWYYYGEWIPCNSQEEFERLIKLRIFW